MKIFNRDGRGSEEIVAAVGLISNDVAFDKWEAVLPFGIRDVSAIVGPEPVAALAAHYESGDDDNDEAIAAAVAMLQQAVAFFTWLKLIPTLDAQHDSTGRAKRLGENEKGLTALQEFKDEENILRLAYEAVDALVEILDVNAFDFWINSRKYRQRRGLLIQSKEAFDEFYNIGSHRLFVTITPIIREMQGSQIAPVIGRQHLAELLESAEGECGAVEVLREPACRALALLTMKKAIERLPVEVIPEGVVQVQQSQPVKSRLKAEQAARAAVAASLGADAAKYLENLQDLVAELDAADAAPDYYVPKPLVHSKGMSY